MWGVPAPGAVPALRGLVWGVPAPEGAGEDHPDGYCCGQYASYWNAFL